MSAPSCAGTPAPRPRGGAAPPRARSPAERPRGPPQHIAVARHDLLGGPGRIGSASCDCAFFCTSTSLTSREGEEAETGTVPLSAPPIPLNTSAAPPVAAVLAEPDSG